MHPVERGSHDQRAEGRRGQDHRHRDGENGIVLAHPDADRVERRRTHVPCDGGRHGRYVVTLSADPMEVEAGGTTMI